MSLLRDCHELAARVQASRATEKAVFKALEKYLEQVKSYGDDLDVDTFYESFCEYYNDSFLTPD